MSEAILSRAGKPILSVNAPREPKAGLYVVNGKPLTTGIIDRLKQEEEWILTWDQKWWKFSATLEDFEWLPTDGFLGFSLRIKASPEDGKTS